MSFRSTILSVSQDPKKENAESESDLSCRSPSSSHQGLKRLKRSLRPSETVSWLSTPKPFSKLKPSKRLWKKLRRIFLLSEECFLEKSWFNQKISDPLFPILRRGAEPKQLAFSAALGITMGVFPICGVTVLLCGVAITSLGSLCHAPTVMLFNFIATPIELSLVVPFLRLGEKLTGGPHFPLTSDALKKVFDYLVNL